MGGVGGLEEKENEKGGRCLREGLGGEKYVVGCKGIWDGRRFEGNGC